MQTKWKEIMNKFKAIASVLGAMAVAGSASALQYEWDFVAGPTSTSSCNSGAVAACKMIFTSSNGQQIAVYAYSSTSQNITIPGNPSTVQARDYGKFTAASLVQFGDAGMGIRNASEPETGAGAPEHAADNKDRYDILVFEALTAQPSKFDWEEVKIGWAQEFSMSGSTVVDQGAKADISFFVGGAANADFTSMCLTTCNGSGGTAITSNGFTHVGTLQDVSDYSTVSIPGTATQTQGRYMVMSGALDTGGSSLLFDAFKIKSVKGTPEPQTIALIGLGLLGMCWVSRRRTLTV